MRPPAILLRLAILSLPFICYVAYIFDLMGTPATFKEQLLRLYSRQTLQGAGNTSSTTNIQEDRNIGSFTYDHNVHEPWPIDACLKRHLSSTFKDALDTYPVVPASDVKIILVVGYYRSASTFVSELLSSGPATFFHFEPLQFTERKRIRPGREGAAFALLNELVRCRMREVPHYMAWMERQHGYKRNRFLADLCQGEPSCFCPSHVSSLCLRARTQVFKFIRLPVAQMAEWIDSNPGIAESVRVIHLVRDPRAILASRRGIEECLKDRECTSAEVLCDQMRSDMNAFDSLAGRMRPYRVHRLRFEDLAADPASEASRLFALLSLEFAPSTSRYLKSHTVGGSEDIKKPYSTKRNTSQVASSWKNKLRLGEIAVIEKACGDVLRRLGYEKELNNTSVKERIVVVASTKS